MLIDGVTAAQTELRWSMPLSYYRPSRHEPHSRMGFTLPNRDSASLLATQSPQVTSRENREAAKSAAVTEPQELGPQPSPGEIRIPVVNGAAGVVPRSPIRVVRKPIMPVQRVALEARAKVIVIRVARDDILPPGSRVVVIR